MATTWGEGGFEKETKNTNRGNVAFFGGKKKSKWKTYKNPPDGSIPGRYKDETLKDYKIRRNKGIQAAMDQM